MPTTRRQAPRALPRHPQRARGPARGHAGGVVLIEVLVSLLVFMLGILGFIGMQTAMIRATADVDWRANATYLANDAIGRMWSDMSNLAGYVGTEECTATACTEWRAKVQQLLPGGTAEIAVDANNNVTIRLDWRLPGGASHHYETQSNISAKSA